MTPEPQDAVIAFLSDPRRLGGGPIEIVETHGSMVFMTGDRAFKLKKAVRYSYLDYSTPQLRQAACAKELSINARFAPSLYLGVRAITREADGGLIFDGAGTPLDWVVEMRRFPSDGQFDRLAERGELTTDLTRRLADQIAAAHEQAAPDPALGGYAATRLVYDRTLADLRRYAAEGGPSAEAVECWAALALAALAAIGPLLERRRRDGKVRAGHGDLHLANICLIDGAPTLFDAIEFDPALSTIDVLYDLAFLLMDLDGRGLRRQANQVFNRYLDLRDEIDGLAALPFFMSMRAAIRAQVTFAATLNTHDAGTVAAARTRSRRHLEQAITLLTAVPPRLVAIGGFSGTGKSTLAQALAPWVGVAPGARALRSDVIRKRSYGVSPETPLPTEAYGPDAHRQTYRRLLAEADDCLRAGHAVIVDAVFGRSDERSAIRAVARELNAPFDALWLTAPQAVLEQRVADRTGDASDATVAVIRSQLAGADDVEDWPSLEASQGPEAIAKAAGVALGVRAG